MIASMQQWAVMLLLSATGTSANIWQKYEGDCLGVLRDGLGWQRLALFPCGSGDDSWRINNGEMSMSQWWGRELCVFIAADGILNVATSTEVDCADGMYINIDGYWKLANGQCVSLQLFVGNSSKEELLQRENASAPCDDKFGGIRNIRLQAKSSEIECTSGWSRMQVPRLIQTKKALVSGKPMGFLARSHRHRRASHAVEDDEQSQLQTIITSSRARPSLTKEL